MKGNVRPTHAVILAGGISSRMGEDKALLPIAGVPMLQRIAATALQIRPAMQVVIVGRDRPDDWPAALPVRFMPDDVTSPKDKHRSAGPLAGLVTALAHLQAPILVIPCDTPLLSAALLEKLVAAHAANPAALATMAFLIYRGVSVEPTLAVYTPALLPTLQQMLKEDRRALHPLVSHHDCRTFEIPSQHQDELLNVNTPDDLAEAERILREQTRPN